MQPLKSPQRVFGKIALIVGASLAAPAVILALISLVSGGLFALNLSSVILGLQGVMWIIIGGSCWYYAKSIEEQAKQLKREGLCYEAEIVRIVPNGMFQIGAFGSVYMECRYINHEGKSCLVKSRLFLMRYLTPLLSDGPSDFGKYTAKVYVNRRDPKDYYVDIQDESQAVIQADYDYR